MRRRTSERVMVLVVAAGLPASVLAQGPLGEPFPATLDISEIDGEIGFVIEGVDVGDAFGLSVGALGDFNGDGVDDVIVGAPNASPIGEPRGGKAYLIFGSTTGFPSLLLASSLDGSNGLVLEGVRAAFGGERAGWAVAGAGDINGDGVGDATIGADRATFPGISGFAGKAYVVFGRQDGVFEPRKALIDLDGSDGFVLKGVDDRDNAGRSVSSAGDTNGDGLDDLMVGVPGRGTGQYSGGYYRCCPGAAYVVYGRDVSGGPGFPAERGLEAFPRSEGFAIRGSDVQGDAGFAVSTAGDVNGDGFGDLVLSAPEVDTYYGECYVVFGRPIDRRTTISLGSLNGTNGFRMTAPKTYEFNYIGRSVDSAGDFNGDGIDDVMVSTGGTGALVVFGRTDGFPAEVDLGSLDGTNGVWLRSSGNSDIAAIGDINGDGIDDVAVGYQYAQGTSGFFSGVVYVVYGSRAGFPGTILLGELDGSDGFHIQASVSSLGIGCSVAAAGDINGDGKDDLLIGAVNTGMPTDAGRAIVVYGRSPDCRADLDGDGTLTIFDFLEFGNLFDLMEPRTDFDGDGEFTLLDFLAFQNEFDAGCP